MHNLKYIYNLMYDDLKDAAMSIDYAEKVMDNKEKSRFYIDEASKRLSMFMTKHEKFMSAVETYKKEHPEEHGDAICWKISHQYFVDWYDMMRHKVETLSKV